MEEGQFSDGLENGDSPAFLGGTHGETAKPTSPKEVDDTWDSLAKVGSPTTSQDGVKPSNTVQVDVKPSNTVQVDASTANQAVVVLLPTDKAKLASQNIDNPTNRAVQVKHSSRQDVVKLISATAVGPSTSEDLADKPTSNVDVEHSTIETKKRKLESPDRIIEGSDTTEGDGGEARQKKVRESFGDRMDSLAQIQSSPSNSALPPVDGSQTGPLKPPAGPTPQPEVTKKSSPQQPRISPGIFDDADEDETFDFPDYTPPSPPPQPNPAFIRPDLVDAIMGTSSKAKATDVDTKDKGQTDNNGKRKKPGKPLKKVLVAKKEQATAEELLKGKIDLLRVLPEEDCRFLGENWIFTLQQLERVLDDTASVSADGQASVTGSKRNLRQELLVELAYSSLLPPEEDDGMPKGHPMDGSDNSAVEGGDTDSAVPESVPKADHPMDGSDISAVEGSATDSAVPESAPKADHPMDGSDISAVEGSATDSAVPESAPKADHPMDGSDISAVEGGDTDSAVPASVPKADSSMDGSDNSTPQGGATDSAVPESIPNAGANQTAGILSSSPVSHSLTSHTDDATVSEQAKPIQSSSQPTTSAEGSTAASQLATNASETVKSEATTPVSTSQSIADDNQVPSDKKEPTIDQESSQISPDNNTNETSTDVATAQLTDPVSKQEEAGDPEVVNPVESAATATNGKKPDESASTPKPVIPPRKAPSSSRLHAAEVRLETWKSSIERWRGENDAVLDTLWNDQFPLDGPLSCLLPVCAKHFLASVSIKSAFDFLSLKKTETGIIIEMMLSWRHKCGVIRMAALPLAKLLIGIGLRMEKAIGSIEPADAATREWMGGPMVVLTAAARDFLIVDHKMYSASEFIERQTKLLANALMEWRKGKGLPPLKGTGNVAMISGWKALVKEYIDVEAGRGRVVTGVDFQKLVESEPPQLPPEEKKTASSSKTQGETKKIKKRKKVDEAKKALNSPSFLLSLFKEENTKVMNSVGIKTAQVCLS
jgi:hypothetical protein